MNNPESGGQQLLNYIRVHRRRSGLTQTELGRLVGYQDAETIARHERSEFMPPLEIAISYEIVFRVPIAEMFAGLRGPLEVRIEASLAELEEELGRRSIREGNAYATARKLMWLKERRNTTDTLG